MNPSQTARDEQVDLLSAYLDGELDDTARERVEQLLARDAAARDELARLRQAWELLDRLPRSQVNPSFTQSTVEMVAVAAAGLQAPPQSPKRRVLWPILLAAGLAVAAAVGFGLGRIAWPDPNQQLLEDLPLVEHLDAYQQAGSIEFLRKLDSSHVFSDSEAAHEP